MNRAVSVQASWNHKYYLAMSVNFGTTSPVSGWYNEGSVVSIAASATNSSGERFLWVGWTGSGTISYSGVVTVTDGSRTSPADPEEPFTRTVSSRSSNRHH